jgi:mannosyltransferase
VAVVVLLVAVSLVLRTGALHAGYWIDEGISVGIASHGFAEIPGRLAQDGSPPLYYLLLHLWMGVFGSGEAATRALSLVFAVATVPVAWWAGRALFDRRAGALAAAGAAGSPFITYYAQETRMYALVVLLSLLASASFVLAFVHGRRGHRLALVAWLTLLLYTHNWGLFLAAGMVVAWLVLRTDGAWAFGAVAVLYLPWLPTFVSQALHTGAPWARRPSPFELLGALGGLFGYVAAPLLVALALAALRRRPAGDTVRVLAIIAGAAAALAWLCTQLEPSWAMRYLAVLLGPLLLALAAVLSRGVAPVALAVVAGIWALSGPPAAKSNVRSVASHVALRPGDLVVSTQPEQVPTLARYLPEGLVYLTPMGIAGDPAMTDWRDGLAQMRRGQAERRLEPLIERLAPGRSVLLVTPIPTRHRSPWSRAVAVRTREWRAALRADPRLRPLGRVPGSALRGRRSNVRAELFQANTLPSYDAPAARARPPVDDAHLRGPLERP